MKKKLLIVVNVDWFFISHRMSIALKAISDGWDVYVASQDTGRSKEIESKGIKFINIPLSRSGTNLVNEFQTILSIYNLYKKVNPDVIHQVTLKPITYGSLIAKFLKVRGVVNAISGLGYSFTSERKGIVQKVMLKLMKFGFNDVNRAVIFQNRDDYKLMNDLGVLNEKNSIHFIKGSGVDLQIYKKESFQNKERIIILFPARMLWDKGVKELKEATDLLKEKYQDKIGFLLAGLADKENKAGVSEAYLKEWEDKDYVKWIGYQKNMLEVYINSDIVVLPTYREGMPKSLIEACAIGRPIVTTDAVGSKECVDEGVNGFKVPVKTSLDLANAMEKLILSKELRHEMGEESRLKAEREFSLESVINKHLEIYNELYAK